MGNFLLKFLFVNFFIHLGLFLWLAATRRKVYYYVLSLTFLLLVLSFSLRIWYPDMEFSGHTLYWYFRMSALATTAAALLLIFRQRQKKTAEQSTDA
jgi:hypothetical protein